MTVSRDLQNIEAIRQSFRAGKTMHTLADSGVFENTLEYPSFEKFPKYKKCEHCGSKIINKESQEEKHKRMKEYSKEEARLQDLFRQALCDFHGLDIEDSKVQKALSIAWEKGHSNGYYEVVNEFEDLIELIK
jgi:DNA-directed RNA polymerase subunit RPC12/RpoP